MGGDTALRMRFCRYLDTWTDSSAGVRPSPIEDQLLAACDEGWWFNETLSRGRRRTGSITLRGAL
jgi:hypothetical protein